MVVRRGEDAGSLKSPEPRATWLWLGVVVLVGLIARIPFLGQPMRQDEADTVVLFAMTPVRHILVDTVIPNNHILHSLFVKFSMAVFGIEPWAVRLPAFIAGVLLIPAAFFAGRALYSTAAGLFGAALVAASSSLILYSTNARGYTLIALATVVCLLCLQRGLETGSWKPWLAFSFVAAAGASVNPSMLYPVGGMVLWAFLEIAGKRPFERARLRQLIVAAALSGVLALIAYFPALMVSGWRSVVSNSYVRPLTWSRFVATLPDFARDLAVYVSDGWPLVLQVLVGASLGAGLVLHRRVARHRWPVAIVMLAWAVFLLLAMRRAPFLRIWLFLVPVFSLVAGAGLAVAMERIRSGAFAQHAGLMATALAALLGSFVVARRAPEQSPETGVFRDGPAMAGHLAGALAPGDIVAARWLAQGPVDFYLRRLGVDAKFAVANDSVAGRLYVLQADTVDETPASIVSYRKLRGVDPSMARVVARFERSAVWVVEPRRVGPDQ